MISCLLLMEKCTITLFVVLHYAVLETGLTALKVICDFVYSTTVVVEMFLDSS